MLNETLDTQAHESGLLEAQRDIEVRSSKEGYERYIKRQDNAPDGITSEAIQMIKGAIPIVSEKIQEWLDGHNANTGRGKRPTALRFLNRLDVDLLSFLTLNTVFSGITKESELVEVQTRVGDQVELEIMALDIEEAQGRKVAARIKEKTSKQGSPRNAKKVFSKFASEHLPQHEPWGQDRKLLVAEPLINAVLTGLREMFEIITIPKGTNKTAVFIRLTEEGVNLFSKLRHSMAWMEPSHRPMVVPPRPWQTFDTGCYYEERTARTVKLVRTFNPDHKKLIKEAIASGQMDYTLQAINTIQNTAWSINQPMLELVRWAFDQGIEGVGLPRNALIDIPQRIAEEVWEQMTPEQRKGHRLDLVGIHERNRGTVGEQHIFHRDIETAEEMARYDRFWMPHNMDFRGRVYPVPHFSPQRSDYVKSLFIFADGEPLGDYGAGWLSVHIANCGDFDKMSKRSFDDRLQWVHDNEQMIVSVGENPYTNVDIWKEADSPFMFVAACMEYAAWVSEGRRRDFVSRIAVALDGSNSGLQHYSAALRSETEASYVSLTPCETPADLYQRIADHVVAEMEKEKANGNTLAAQCLEAGIGRNTVKRNVMTFAYSSEKFGFRQQIMSDLMSPINNEVFLGKRDVNPYATNRVNKETGEVSSELDGGFSASLYISGKVWQAVTETVQKATEGMNFFKKTAAALAHEKQPLIWTSPIGLPVVHQYNVWDTKAVSMNLFDRRVPVTEALTKDIISGDGDVLRRVVLTIRTKPTEVIDKSKARSAVAPNVIHSMDGAHLMLTVLNAHYEGYKDFALIHDSFGTHAGRTQRFFEIIRESFVEMYENYCPFEEVMDYAQSVLSEEGKEKLPDLPTKGDWDLNEVLDADYAFA